MSDTGETDVANRLTGDDAYSYVYDLNGNLLTKTAKPGVTRPDWTYDYDDLDQLISVSRDGVEVERYRYDAFGRRSVIEAANEAGAFIRTAIVNDGSDRTIDLVQDGAGATLIQNRYTHGGQVDEPLSLEVFTAGGTLDQAYTYHADHLGSIRFVTDSVGTIVNAYEYDSYGRPGFEVEQVAQPFRYTGREWDQATELYHYRARQYDPETGKFLQEDPIGTTIGLFDNMSNLETGFSNGVIGQSRSIENLGGLKTYNLNLYKYVENNPLIYVDYSGLIFGLSYSKTKKSAVSLTRSLRFRLKKRLNILPRARNTPNSLRHPNGQFTGNAAAQEFRRAETIRLITECIKNIGAGFQVTADTDKGLSVSGGTATLGQRISLLLCTGAGALGGAAVKAKGI